MNQPDVLSQIQPEGDHNTEDQAGPEESEIPTDPSEGKWEKRLSSPCLSFLVRDDGSVLSKQGLGSSSLLVLKQLDCEWIIRHLNRRGSLEITLSNAFTHQYHTSEGYDKGSET